MNKSKIVLLWIVASMSSKEQVEGASPPHFQFLLSKSVVKATIRKLFIRHSLLLRHAQPSLLPVKEVVSVLSLHKASQPSNMSPARNDQAHTGCLRRASVRPDRQQQQSTKTPQKYPPSARLHSFGRMAHHHQMPAPLQLPFLIFPPPVTPSSPRPVAVHPPSTLPLA